MNTDPISVYRVATEIEKVAPITGRDRALRGLYGPVSYRAGDGRRTMLVSKAELRKRGILPAEPLPTGPTVDAYEVARDIFNAIAAAWPDDRATRLNVTRALWPALTKLAPMTAKEIEGITEGEAKEETPGVPTR
jgi:hypothetical protein